MTKSSACSECSPSPGTVGLLGSMRMQGDLPWLLFVFLVTNDADRHLSTYLSSSHVLSRSNCSDLLAMFFKSCQFCLVTRAVCVVCFRLV